MHNTSDRCVRHLMLSSQLTDASAGCVSAADGDNRFVGELGAVMPHTLLAAVPRHIGHITLPVIPAKVVEPVVLVVAVLVAGFRFAGRRRPNESGQHQTVDEKAFGLSVAAQRNRIMRPLTVASVQFEQLAGYVVDNFATPPAGLFDRMRQRSRAAFVRHFVVLIPRNREPAFHA